MLKKFGAFFIATGIVVTGVLWYEREDGVVAGEDMAAIIQQTMDVALIPRLFGNEVPDYWGSGFDSFGSNILKGAVISMEDLRKVALRVEALPQWSNPAWIDLAYSDVFADGAEIMTCTNKPLMVVSTNFHYDTSTYYEVRDYRAVTPTPISHVRTLAGRAWNGAMPFERGISPTNDPICRWLDAGAGIAFDYPMWPSGSFWTTNMGAKAYTLPFKKNHTQEDYTVYVKPFAISGMTLVDNVENPVSSSVVSLSLGGPQRGARVVTTYQPATTQKYALLNIFTPDGQMYSFSAAGGFSMQQVAAVAGASIVVAPGDNVIQVRRNIQLPANGRLVAEVLQNPGRYTVAGCNVYTNDAGVYDLTLNMSPWITPTRADLLRLWLDVPGVTPVPVHVAIGPAPSAMQSEPIRLSEFTKAVINNVAGVNIWLNANQSNAVTTVYDRTITRRNLDAIRAVLTNCMTSAYISASPFLSSRHTRTYSSSDKSDPNGSGSFLSNLGALFSATDYTYTAEGSGNEYIIASCQSFEDKWTYSDGAVYPSFTGHQSLERPSVASYVLSYPSAYAVTNGYVSRIRVFTVWMYTAQSRDSMFPWSPWEVQSSGFFEEDIPLSWMPRLSLCDESAVMKTGDSSGHYKDSYNGVTGFRGITLNQIYEVSNPTTTNDLAFTYTFPEISHINPAKDNYHFLRPVSQNKTGLEIKALTYYIVTTAIRRVIVVDWKWSPNYSE